MSEAGFDVPAGSDVEPGPDFDEQIATVLASIGVPAVVKPSTGRGGSLGVEYLPDERALRRHLRRLFARGPEAVLVEEFVRGIEVTAWVWERDNHDVVDLVEIEKEGPIFTRNSKTGYRREGLHLHEEYPTAQLHRPPRLPAAVLARVEETAIGVHRLFGARGYSRTDLIVRDDRPVVLEINTTPRLRAESSFGMSPERTGGFAALLATLVDDAVSSGPLPRADAPRSVASRPW